MRGCGRGGLGDAPACVKQPSAFCLSARLGMAAIRPRYHLHLIPLLQERRTPPATLSSDLPHPPLYLSAPSLPPSLLFSPSVARVPHLPILAVFFFLSFWAVAPDMSVPSPPSPPSLLSSVLFPSVSGGVLSHSHRCRTSFSFTVSFYMTNCAFLLFLHRRRRAFRIAAERSSPPF